MHTAFKPFGSALRYLNCMRQLFTSAIVAWFAHRATSKGAALAFYTIFSLTPILVLVIAVTGYFLGEQAAQGHVIEELSMLVGESGARVISSLLAASSNHTSGMIASVVAALLIFIGATTVFAELKASLDEIWEVEKAVVSNKHAFKQLLITRLTSFGLIIILSALLMSSLLASAGLGLIEHYANYFLGGYLDFLLQHMAIFKYISTLLSFAVITAMFAVVYKMLPDVRLSWSDVVVGAVLTALLFGLGKLLIGMYLSRSGISSSFGAAGSLIALLLWIYYSAQIFFFGAEVTRQFALTYGSLKEQNDQP